MTVKLNFTESRQGTANSRTLAPNNESADCWSATHSNNFNIRIKSMHQIMSILIGWGKTYDLALSLFSLLGYFIKLAILSQLKNNYTSENYIKALKY